LPNPLYATTAAEYEAYHLLMLDMEAKVTEMHNLINSVAAKHGQLEQLTGILPAGEKYKAVRASAQTLLAKMKTWDGDMVQRKSKAYDDVENFPNKFTADYMFMLNQTESDIPRVNQPSLDLKRALEGEWAVLKTRADDLFRDLNVLNKMLWENGIGGIWQE
jgi:hypothetical protein